MKEKDAGQEFVAQQDSAPAQGSRGQESQDLGVQSQEKWAMFKKSGKSNIKSGKVRILPLSFANVKTSIYFV